MYYRVAIQTRRDACLKWKSSPLTSLDTLFRFLRFYRAIPQDSLRIFTAPSREELDAMLMYENEGLANNSVTAGQFLSERRISSAGSRQEGAAARMPELRRTRTGTLTPLAPLPPSAPLPPTRVQEPVLKEQSMSVLERRRFELEMGPGGDHDQPYTFTLPLQVPQLLAWTRLMVRVQQG